MYARPNPRFGSTKHSGAPRQGKLWRSVSRTVDDQDLATGPGPPETLVAPRHEVRDAELFVDGWDDNGDLRVVGIVGRDEELKLGVWAGRGESPEVDRMIRTVTVCGRQRH